MDAPFEWDSRKAAANLKKHGVSFDDACQVFLDLVARTVGDAAHTLDERRFRTIGRIPDGRTLVVFHADRGDTIRIIGASARLSVSNTIYEEDPAYS